MFPLILLCVLSFLAQVKERNKMLLQLPEDILY